MMQKLLFYKRKEMIQKEYFKKTCTILENFSSDLKKIVLFFLGTKQKFLFFFSVFERKTGILFTIQLIINLMEKNIIYFSLLHFSKILTIANILQFFHTF